MKKFILFDFDGVIIDSFNPAFEAVQLMCPLVTSEQMKKGFEGNINEWVKSEITHNEKCRHDIDFVEEYVPRLLLQAKIFPGMDEVIKLLAKQYNLIVISSTLTAPIQEILGKYNLVEYFTEIMGNDVHKSKIEKMKLVFSKYGVTSKDCLFITDTLGDMKEALHCEVGVIGVTWGFHKLETLERGNSYKIVSKPEELVGAVGEYFNYSYN